MDEGGVEADVQAVGAFEDGSATVIAGSAAGTVRLAKVTAVGMVRSVIGPPGEMLERAVPADHEFAR